MRCAHHSVACMSTRHACDVFQSSRTSWSSKIIALGSGREQPADLGPAPCLGVERRVLVVVDDLVLWTRPICAAVADEPPHRRRRVVRIHLVAEHEDDVRPILVRLARHAVGIHAQDVRVAAGMLVLGLAARAEQDANRCDAAERPDPARGKGRIGQRPDAAAVEVDRVLDRGGGLEAADDDDRVVMAGDLERPVGGDSVAGTDGDRAGARGLEPDRGVPLADVPQERTQPERRHGVAVRCPRSVRSTVGTGRRRARPRRGRRSCRRRARSSRRCPPTTGSTRSCRADRRSGTPAGAARSPARAPS